MWISKIRPSWAVLICCLLLIANTDGARKKTRKRVVCYYTNWSVYRLGLAKFVPSNINPYLCTHLIYAFGGFDEDFQLQPFDKYQDIEKGGYARFNGLKQYNKGLRTLLALGGWNEGSGRFSELVASPEYRQKFIYSAIRYLRQYNFDGLDLDWEYPGSRAGSAPEDKENYATLCEEMRAAFEEESLKTNRPTLLLTVAVPAGISTIEKGFDVPRLNAAVDFFNILAYDYHASTEALTDHHAPLLPPPGTSEFDFRSELNVDYTVRFYLKSGAERRKLVVGMPTYGRSYTLLDEAYNSIQAAAESPGLKGKYTKEEGYLSFYEICEFVAVDEWTVYRPYPDEMGPYATSGKQWVGYDDEFAVQKKAEYVRDNRLGGIMFWSVDNDDFRGRCSGKPYPLIEAAKEAYLKPAPGGRPKQAKGPTPPPPVTPDPGADFSCKREGFFAHPEECNKYFWCLAGGPLGIVPHSFTCPSGLLFNRNTDACDFPRNVKCKIVEKTVETITFPPTKEPLVTPAPTPGEATPDPFEDFYEDYDESDLPELDLDFPTRLSASSFNTRPTSTPQVLGGSRGNSAVRKPDSETTTGAAPQDEESDPQELKQLLQLIQNLGGVDGVKNLLEGGSDSAGAQLISEKDRQTLSKIVGSTRRQQTTTSTSSRTNQRTSSSTNTRTRPSVATRRRPSVSSTSSDSSSSSSGSRQRLNTRNRLRPSGGAPSRRRPAPSPAQGTEVTTREQEVSSGGRLNARRRPQYSSIQRNRGAQTSRDEPVAEDVEAPVEEDVVGQDGGQRQYVTLNRRRPSSSVESRQTEERTQDDDDTREYVTLRRSRPTTPVPPLEGAPERERAPPQVNRGITIKRPGNRAPQLFRLTSTLPPRLTSTQVTTEATAEGEEEEEEEELIRIRRPPPRPRPRPASRTRTSSIRDRLRQRGQNRAENRRPPGRPSTTTTSTTTTTTTAVPVLTTPAPSGPQVEAPRPETTLEDVRRPAHQGVRGFDPNAGLQPEDRREPEYDYYFDYVFEYPDGTIKEIPAEELESLREEIELAKQALLAKTGKSFEPAPPLPQTVRDRFRPTLPQPPPTTERLRPTTRLPPATTQRISPFSVTSSRPIAQSQATDNIGFIRIPEGYEVTEYEYEIDGDVDEDVLVFEDEDGARVVSTTYRPVDDTATESPFRVQQFPEDSTLRQFFVPTDTTTPGTRTLAVTASSAPDFTRRPPGRLVPSNNFLDALDRRRQPETDTESPVITSSQRPVTSTRRFPSTLRTFRPVSIDTSAPFGPPQQTTEAEDEVTTLRPSLSATTIQSLLEQQRERLRPTQNSLFPVSSIDEDRTTEFSTEETTEPVFEVGTDAATEPAAPETTTEPQVETTAVTTLTTEEERNEVEPSRGSRRFGVRDRFNRFRSSAARSRPSAATTTQRPRPPRVRGQPGSRRRLTSRLRRPSAGTEADQEQQQERPSSTTERPAIPERQPQPTRPARTRVRPGRRRILGNRLRRPSLSRTTEEPATTSPATEEQPLSDITSRSTASVIQPTRPSVDVTTVSGLSQTDDQESRFQQFLRETDADVSSLSIEQLRDIFTRTIQKTAVFVRRKPGAAEPEIIGRGTVISQPGGDRRLILQNRPTSEITLIETSTLSSLLSTTPAPRTGISPRPFPDQPGISPRPFTDDPQGQATERSEVFSPSFSFLPQLLDTQEPEDTRSPTEQVIEDVTSRIFTNVDPFEEVRGTSARSVLNIEPTFRNTAFPETSTKPYNSSEDTDAALFALQTQNPFIFPSNTEPDEPAPITEPATEAPPEPLVIRKQVVRRIQRPRDSARRPVRPETRTRRPVRPETTTEPSTTQQPEVERTTAAGRRRRLRPGVRRRVQKITRRILDLGDAAEEEEEPVELTGAAFDGSKSLDDPQPIAGFNTGNDENVQSPRDNIIRITARRRLPNRRRFKPNPLVETSLKQGVRAELDALTSSRPEAVETTTDSVPPPLETTTISGQEELEPLTIPPPRRVDRPSRRADILFSGGESEQENIISLARSVGDGPSEVRVEQTTETLRGGYFPDASEEYIDDLVGDERSDRELDGEVFQPDSGSFRREGRLVVRQPLSRTSRRLQSVSSRQQFRSRQPVTPDSTERTSKRVIYPIVRRPDPVQSTQQTPTTGPPRSRGSSRFTTHHPYYRTITELTYDRYTRVTPPTDVLRKESGAELQGALAAERLDGRTAALVDELGRVTCQDVGLFPHPRSCSQFVRCASPFPGVIRGHVFQCPSGLVFDPVGGKCNWAEVTDCVGQEAK